MADFIWMIFLFVFAFNLINWQGYPAVNSTSSPTPIGGVSTFPLTSTPTAHFPPTSTPTPQNNLTPTRTPTPTLFIGSTNTPIPTITPNPNGLSKSKLGVFILGDTSAVLEILRAGPKVVKIIDPQNSPQLREKIREYKQLYPAGKVIIRIYTPSYDPNDPENSGPGYNYHQISAQEAARDYFNNWIKPELDKIPVSDRVYYDFVAGPNENDNFQAIAMYQQDDRLSWMSGFFSEYAALVKNDGRYKPLLGEIPVSNLDPRKVGLLSNGLITIKTYGGAWSYHAYSTARTQNHETEINTSLRYRSFYNNLPENLQSLPIILSETGFDTVGQGWNRGGANDKSIYQSWLSWYDDRLIENSYVLGATIFQIGSGDPTWASFDLQPIASWFASYLTNK